MIHSLIIIPESGFKIGIKRKSVWHIRLGGGAEEREEKNSKY